MNVPELVRQLRAQAVVDTNAIAELRAEVERLRAGRETEQAMLWNAVQKILAHEATIERIQALHNRDSVGYLCDHCNRMWPCVTIRALDPPAKEEK